MVARTRILVVHGAGDGAHEEDKPIADFVRAQARDPDAVAYPRIEGLERMDGSIAQRDLKAAVASLAEGARIVAHSAGGAAVLKLLSDEAKPRQIAALSLLAIPYLCKDGAWGSDESALENDFASRLPEIGSITLYHSQDDDIVPVGHVRRYAEKLPSAKVVVVDGHGHQFSSRPFQELADDLSR